MVNVPKIVLYVDVMCCDLISDCVLDVDGMHIVILLVMMMMIMMMGMIFFVGVYTHHWFSKYVLTLTQRIKPDQTLRVSAVHNV